MKRVLLLSTLIAIILICYGESRKFFCLENDKCITVWKTYNNICYIIPGKYYGVLRPSKGYIQTLNTNNITIYFTSELQNALVFRSEQSLKISNSDKGNFIFYDYTQDEKKFDSILYLHDAKKNSDVKDNVGLIEVFIQENYALDKLGRKL